jgi:RNA polymerase sigma-B factor
VLEAREAAGAYRAVSLDRPRGEEAEEGDAFADVFEDRMEPRLHAGRACRDRREPHGVLSEREREVLRLRFEED